MKDKAQLTSIDRIAEGPEPSTTGQRLLSSPDGAVTLMLSDNETLKVDHVILGTGYRVDVKKLPMLAPSLVSEVQTY